MIVGVCRITLQLEDCHSDKDKRSVLRRIKDRVHQKWNCAIAEVGDGDSWDTAQLGFVVLSNQRGYTQSQVQKILQFIDDLAFARVSEVEESVLFERVRIGRHAKIRRCIIDKDVEIPAGMSIGFDPDEDRSQALAAARPRADRVSVGLAGVRIDRQSQRSQQSQQTGQRGALTVRRAVGSSAGGSVVCARTSSCWSRCGVAESPTEVSRVAILLRDLCRRAVAAVFVVCLCPGLWRSCPAAAAR